MSTGVKSHSGVRKSTPLPSALALEKVWGLGEVVPIHSQKILIADDEYLIRWSLAQALTQEGYEVIAVEDGKKAIEAVRTGNFDFIITDLVMPESDGWELLEFVRQVPTPPRVIMITAHGKEDTEKIAKEKGAWAYVEKPFIIKKIKNLVMQGVS